MVVDIRHVAIQLLASGLQEGNPRRRASILEAYWDLMYLYRFGLPVPVTVPEIHFPPIPGPDPLPISIARDHSLLLFELVNLVVGDPEPEPVLVGDPEPQPNLKTFLGREARLAAVKALHERLTRAVKLADVEITRLTKQG